MGIRIHCLLMAAACLFSPWVARAEVRLPSLFSDRMVMQQGMAVPVWGWASPGERVTVEFKDQKLSAEAGADGRWRVELQAMPASANPVSMKVSGKNSLQVRDILVGEVWLCAGGTNMEMWPAQDGQKIQNGDAEIASANWPAIRCFTVPRTASRLPQESGDGQWRAVSPDSVRECSALAYFFGRHLHRELKGVPVGLVVAAWRDTRIETWCSYEALKGQPDFKAAAEEAEQAALGVDRTRADYGKLLEEWRAKDLGCEPGGKDGREKPEFDDSGWTPVKIPEQQWKDDPQLKDLGNTAVWYRRIVAVPDEWKDGDLAMDLGVLDDEDLTFVNGVEVGRNDSYVAWRSYRVPEAIWKKSRPALSIAVRIINYRADCGFMSPAPKLRLFPAGKPELAVPLAGDCWRRSGPGKLGKRLPKPKEPGLLQAADPLKDRLATLHNTMIAPLVPYAIRGAVWSQGEANEANPSSYAGCFAALAADWRRRWKCDFPIYCAQIAPHAGGEGSAVEAVQAAQVQVAGSVPGCGLVCMNDLGSLSAKAIPNRQEAGRRLALMAVYSTYGRNDIVCSGPAVRSIEVKGKEVRIHFSSTGGVLVARGESLAGFSVAGAEGIYLPAKARLEGETVVVWSDLAPRPAAVRYGGSEDASRLTLSNAAGLPAMPFVLSVGQQNP